MSRNHLMACLLAPKIKITTKAKAGFAYQKDKWPKTVKNHTQKWYKAIFPTGGFSKAQTRPTAHPIMMYNSVKRDQNNIGGLKAFLSRHTNWELQLGYCYGKSPPTNTGWYPLQEWFYFVVSHFPFCFGKLNNFYASENFKSVSLFALWSILNFFWCLSQTRRGNHLRKAHCLGKILETRSTIAQKSSVSFTPSTACTTTTVAFQPKATEDKVSLSFFLKAKLQAFHPKPAAFFERYALRSFYQHQLHITTSNSFPHSSGIASMRRIYTQHYEHGANGPSRIVRNRHVKKSEFLARSIRKLRSITGPMVVWENTTLIGKQFAFGVRSGTSCISILSGHYFVGG